MSSSKGMVLAVLGLAAVMVVVGLWIIWPNYRQARAIRGQIAQLESKVAGLGGQARQVQQLASDVETLQHRVDHELKTIPPQADLADLIGKLSQEVDRVRVVDQTFTAGSVSEALVGGPALRAAHVNAPGSESRRAAYLAMPLTVDMEATFDSVFALIQNVESMDRLVRITSVSVSCKRDEKARQVDTSKGGKGGVSPVDFSTLRGVEMSSPLVKATVSMEAIFVARPAGDPWREAGGEGG